MTRWFFRFIMQWSVRIIILLIFFDIFKLLSVDTSEVVVSSDTTRLELTHHVERCLQVVQHMLWSKDVATDMVRCSSDELALVG